MLKKMVLLLAILSLGLIISPTWVEAAPTISSITPSAASNWGIVEISDLAGTGFEQGARVTLTRDGRPQIMVFATVESPTKISGAIEVMGAEPGLWSVVVTNPDEQTATLVGGLTLETPPPPVVISNTPHLSDNMGIVRVELTGQNFLRGAQMKLVREGLDDINAIFVVVQSPTKIICDFNLTGVEVGHWDIMVVNPDGQTGISNSLDITQAQDSEGFVVVNNAHFYVDAINGSDSTGDGSLANPWKTVTYALNHVSGTGNTVHVAAGAYNQALGETFPMPMRDGVSLVGAGPGNTILDAEDSNRVIVCYNIGTGETIDGFAIRNGRWTNMLEGGAGIYCYSGSSPTIHNCTISNNTGNWGGGIASWDTSSPVITNCIIRDNFAGRRGGGIQATSGGGITVANSVISGNTAVSGGGGIDLHHYVNRPTITNCIISGNNAINGGGIMCDWSHVTITNCTVTGNRAEYDWQTGYGGGLYCVSASATVVNSIFWGNEAEEGGSQIYDLISPVGVTYSNIQGGWGTSEDHNIDIAPLFVNPRPASEAPTSAGNYHLTAGSPCIYAGTNGTLAYPDIPADDVDGDSRPRGGAYDMGADEVLCPDTDNDGSYPEEGCGSAELDCDDTDATVYTGATELCDGKDNNCNGQLDEGLTQNTYYHDADGDGFGDSASMIIACAEPSGYVADDTDCDDADSTVYPGNEELCDGKDNNCDGQSDEGCCQIIVPDDFGSIQGAINAASDGCEIVARSGTYTENINFNGKAIAVRSEGGPDNTVIDGNASGSVVTFASGEGEDSVLDGFTITNGWATYTGGPAPPPRCGAVCHAFLIPPDFIVVSGGGGIKCSSSSPTLVNCTIVGNTAIYGGAIYSGSPMFHPELGASPKVVNCTISHNAAFYYGDGIFCDWGSSLTIVNSILWGDDGHEVYEAFGKPDYNAASVNVSFSDVQGGWPGQGNITADPLFVGDGDYHLAEGSPCIDAGTGQGAPNHDIDGEPRPQGTAYDMGSDEAVVVADSDGDGIPDDEDHCPTLPAPELVLMDYTGDFLLPIDETGGAAATLAATLTDENGQGLTDVPLSFSVIDSEGNLDGECSANTGSSGEASCNLDGLESDVYAVMVESSQLGCPVASAEALLVVFDPNVPRATGGGFILPDAESTLPAETSKDKANFGFIVRLDKNQAAAGNLEFQYKTAGINLKSQDMTWYTVSNNNAMFQGEATINGDGLYTFRVHATDGDLTGGQPDAFDVKIWEGTDTEADLFHQAKNDLAGGSIVIHKH